MPKMRWVEDRMPASATLPRRACLILAGSLAMLFAGANVGIGAGASDPNVRIVDGIAVYLGIMPAAIIRGHAPGHPESTMHGGAPRSSAQRHIVVALFDAKTFERIVDADVTASVQGLGHTAWTSKKLERMDIADASTFGSYFPFQGKDKFTIRLEIKIAKRPKAVIVEFTYET